MARSSAADPAPGLARVDEIDEAIIGLLQDDGRRTYSDIAGEVGLSEAATRQRVNRLREAGTLRIVAVTDPIALGLRAVAMVGIRVSGDVRAAAKQVAKVHAIEYVVISSGSFDLLVEIICEDERRLLEIINNDIRGVDGVLHAETFIYMHIEKQIFAWGGRTDRGPGPGSTSISSASRSAARGKARR